jgi:hypothetical protein
MLEGLYFSVFITNKPNTGNDEWCNDDDLETKGTYCCITLQEITLNTWDFSSVRISTKVMMCLPRCYGSRLGYE